MKGNLAYERLHANLQVLNLGTDERGIDTVLENGVRGDRSLTDVLDELLHQEVTARQALSTETRARHAGFPVRKTLDEFDFEFQPSVDPTLIRELATMRFVHNAENVILVGPAGVGKTTSRSRSAWRPLGAASRSPSTARAARSGSRDRRSTGRCSSGRYGTSDDRSC